MLPIRGQQTNSVLAPVIGNRTDCINAQREDPLQIDKHVVQFVPWDFALIEHVIARQPALPGILPAARLAEKSVPLKLAMRVERGQDYVVNAALSVLPDRQIAGLAHDNDVLALYGDLVFSRLLQSAGWNEEDRAAKKDVALRQVRSRDQVIPGILQDVLSHGVSLPGRRRSAADGKNLAET